MVHEIKSFEIVGKVVDKSLFKEMKRWLSGNIDLFVSSDYKRNEIEEKFDGMIVRNTTTKIDYIWRESKKEWEMKKEEKVEKTVMLPSESNTKNKKRKKRK
jgi:hypothetical protein